MGRLSARSNPTGLKELNRSSVSISVTEAAGVRSFTVDRLNLDGTGLAKNLKVIVVARAGNTNSRHELGTVSNIFRQSTIINDLDSSQPLRFRILIHEENNPKLVASIENLRARDDSQSESLLPMEPANLGERLWKLVISDDGPILQFNSMVFPNAAGAENYMPFGALVLPEALRQIMEKIADEPQRLEDEDDSWNTWGRWLDTIGIDRPQVEDDEEVKSTWCNRVVDRFCERFKFATLLQSELLTKAENG